MIPQLTRSRHPVSRQPVWPEPSAQQLRSGALFGERPALRKLVVLADAELLAAPEDTALSQNVLLTGLLTHPYIELLRHSDDGPPPDTLRRPYGPPDGGLTSAEGWAELGPAGGGESRGLTFTDPSGPIYTGILNRRTDYARHDIALPVYRHLDPAEAGDRRVRDAIAVLVAEKVGADLFVSDRPYLLASGGSPAQGVTVCRTPEALAFVALYLRAQKDFIVWKPADGHGTSGMNEGLYYWVGTRELLPTTWRWFTACVQESNATNDETLLDLGQSLLRRVQRALQARDQLHRVFNMPQNNDTASAVLSELDSVLVLLMGAVDVSARVAHLVLGISGSIFNIGWQKTSWLASVSAAEPTLGSLYAPGTQLQHTLTILRLLRNTVHGQMIRSIAVRQAGPIETVIKLPPNMSPKF